MIYTLLTLYAFYVGFALSVSVYRQWCKGTLNAFNKLIFAPILIAFIVVDVILNYTVLLVSMGPPPVHNYTISDRFYTYHHGTYGWKTKVATITCEKLLNTIDPSGQHC